MTGDRLALGMNLPTWPLRNGGHATWSEMRRLARDVEAAGVDTLWAPDHLQRRVAGRPTIGFWECWTIVTAAAEATSSIGIGPFVACTGFRNPALLARMATTLDEVSGGRLVLGLGSGVPATDETWRAFGYDPVAHVGRHEEAVEIIATLLRDGRVTFEGGHYRIDGVELVPPGPRPQGPPIWVAGKGERTMRIAARWGDAVNVNRPLATVDDLAAIQTSVAAACAAVGRDPATLQVTGWARIAVGDGGSGVRREGWLAGSPAEIGATARALRRGGLGHLTLYVAPEDDPSPLPALTRSNLDLAMPFLEAIRAG